MNRIYFKKRAISILLSSVLILILSACSLNVSIGLPSLSPSGSNSTEYDPKVTQTTEGTSQDTQAQLMVYTSVLEGIYFDHIFPDGYDCEWQDYDDNQNRFAVYDIDNDGAEELIVQYTTTCMAGMVELIYNYDQNTKSVTEEFIEFPALTYYDNGIIVAEWSHNQGLAGDNFWPYTLYQYDSALDTYIEVGTVDAWDRTYAKTDYYGNPFPTESDANGDGIVYFITQDGEYNLDKPVDLEEYMQWRDSYLGTATEITVPYLNLTEENINSIQ